MKKLAAVAICVACVLALSGCAAQETAETGENDAPVRIGTMPTEDILPMWVAEQDGLFAESDVNAEVVTFDSAQALSAAIAAGEVDMAMVDVMRAVKLCESGTPVVMEWITLGTEASQGAFGVMAAADAPYSSLEEFADYASTHDDAWATAGVGVAANTVPEYVFDKLCEESAIDVSQLPIQEVASLPERYNLMTNGNLSAAALPASLLALGQADGMKLLAIDTEGENISQSVMVARGSFAETETGAHAIEAIAEAWNAAVDAIASNPSAYAALLAEKANLNSKIADSYSVSSYPYATIGGNEAGPDTMAYPKSALVDPQIAWMAQKGYSNKSIAYNEQTGKVTIG